VTGGGQIIGGKWKTRPKPGGCVIWYELQLSNKRIKSDAEFFIQLETNTVHPNNDLALKIFYMSQYGAEEIYSPLEGIPLK